MYDVIIVGGGPAGLNAALILGRCRRSVVIVDANQPRNFASRHLHGFLTRDGITPRDLLKIGREQLSSYGVELRNSEAVDALRSDDGFTISLSDGEKLRCRALLLATGVVDHLPEIDGMSEFYGRGVFHCPYCDGWEVKDLLLAVYGRGKSGANSALGLKTWSSDVVLLTDGRPYLPPDQARLLAKHHIPVHVERIKRLEGSKRGLARVVFTNGTSIERQALFLSTGQHQKSSLATRLGCEFNEKGTIRANVLQRTGIEGLYVAGDACRDVQFAVVAAAEGAKAGLAINKMLQENSR